MIATYFIKDGQRIKIGVTKNIIQRMKSVKTMIPDAELLAIKDGNYESKLHSAFAKYNLGGEWFISEVVEPLLKAIGKTTKEDSILSIIDSYRDVVKKEVPMTPNEYAVKGMIKILITQLGYDSSSMVCVSKYRGCEYYMGNVKLVTAYVNNKNPKLKAGTDFPFENDLTLNAAQLKKVMEHITTQMSRTNDKMDKRTTQNKRTGSSNN